MDGAFRIPSLHGTGILVANAAEANLYVVGSGADQVGLKPIGNRFENSQANTAVAYGIIGPDIVHSLKQVTIPDTDNEGASSIELIPHEKQTIKLRGTNGTPISQVKVIGRMPKFAGAQNYEPLEEPETTDDTVEVIGLKQDGKRLMLFRHSASGLGKAEIVEDQTTEVQLEPGATIVGRVVDAKDTPLPNVEVSLSIDNATFPKSKDGRYFPTYLKIDIQSSTDQDGRFKIGSIPPGIGYQVHLGMGVNKPYQSPILKQGETIDAGTLKINH